MGQVTLPVLNRKGFSSVWDNHWDTTLNYTKKLNEDFFLKKFFKIFLRNWYSNKNYFFSKKNKNIKIKKKTRLIKYNFEKYKDTQNKLKTITNKKFTYNYSKIFIIRYNNWLILYMYIYVPKVWITRLKKKKKKLFNYKYISDLYLYHTTKCNKQ